ncbi:MAG: hypothetical protein HY744_32205 [Deltaproteobacteria bacterium]|nr:hypothetical protein [Deltaproteobacteria bacterium]
MTHRVMALGWATVALGCAGSPRSRLLAADLPTVDLASAASAIAALQLLDFAASPGTVDFVLHEARPAWQCPRAPAPLPLHLRPNDTRMERLAGALARAR